MKPRPKLHNLPKNKNAPTTIPTTTESVQDRGQAQKNKKPFPEVGPYGHSNPMGAGAKGRRQGGTLKKQINHFDSFSSVPAHIARKSTPLWERGAIAIGNIEKVTEDQRRKLGDQLNNRFKFVRWLLMITGQYPFYHVNVDGVWKIGWFYFKWNMIWFKILGFCMVIGFLLVVASIIQIMTRGRYHPKSMTNSQILAQALLERHTQFMMHMVIYLFLSSLWACLLIYRKRLWLKVLNGIWHLTWETGIDFSKINNREVIPYCGAYFFTMIVFICVSIWQPSPQTYGCPTILTYTMFYMFIPAKTLNPAYPTSPAYYKFSGVGAFLILLVMFTAHVPLVLYFWSMSVIKSAWHSWNQRMHFHVCRGEENSSEGQRTTYELMYWDVNRLLDLTCDMDELWSILYESYLFLIMLLLCFENGFAIKVGIEHDSPLSEDDWGQRFKRPNDSRTSLVLAPFNLTLLSLLVISASWATDAAGAGYDIMRRKAFIDGLTTNPQVYFTTGLIQMYSVLRKIGFEFGRYVDVSRSNLLVLLNLVITTSIVVYQLRIHNDMLTLNDPRAHFLVGNFLADLEGHDKTNYTIMVRRSKELDD